MKNLSVQKRCSNTYSMFGTPRSHLFIYHIPNCVFQTPVSGAKPCMTLRNCVTGCDSKIERNLVLDYKVRVAERFTGDWNGQTQTELSLIAWEHQLLDRNLEFHSLASENRTLLSLSIHLFCWLLQRSNTLLECRNLAKLQFLPELRGGSLVLASTECALKDE